MGAFLSAVWGGYVCVSFPLPPASRRQFGFCVSSRRPCSTLLGDARADWWLICRFGHATRGWHRRRSRRGLRSTLNLRHWAHRGLTGSGSGLEARRGARSPDGVDPKGGGRVLRTGTDPAPGLRPRRACVTERAPIVTTSAPPSRRRSSTRSRSLRCRRPREIVPLPPLPGFGLHKPPKARCRYFHGTLLLAFRLVNTTFRSVSDGRRPLPLPRDRRPSSLAHSLDGITFPRPGAWTGRSPSCSPRGRCAGSTSFLRHGALLSGALLALRRRPVRGIQLQGGSERDSELLAVVELSDRLDPGEGSFHKTRSCLDLLHGAASPRPSTRGRDRRCDVRLVRICERRRRHRGSRPESARCCCRYSSPSSHRRTAASEPSCAGQREGDCALLCSFASWPTAWIPDPTRQPRPPWVWAAFWIRPVAVSGSAASEDASFDCQTSPPSPLLRTRRGAFSF